MIRTICVALPVTFILAAACSSGGAGTIGDAGLDSDGGASDASTDGARKDGAGGGDGGGGNGTCHANAECRTGFEICVAPGEFLCGGVAPLHACNTDPDCADAGADRVCVKDSCGGSQCQPKCTQDAECGSPLLSCDTSSGQCGPKACTASSCPVNYTCQGAQGCVRTPCTTDSQCNGACINGRCWGGIGQCQAVPA